MSTCFRFKFIPICPGFSKIQFHLLQFRISPVKHGRFRIKRFCSACVFELKGYYYWLIAFVFTHSAWHVTQWDRVLHHLVGRLRYNHVHFVAHSTRYIQSIKQSINYGIQPEVKPSTNWEHLNKVNKITEDTMICSRDRTQWWHRGNLRLPGISVVPRDYQIAKN